ncbi:MAG: ATP-dependent Clp protease ATP-binding subunit [Deltaproteobacteria bacterium]|nr:ATP-dependent Clp protease ATP-binding subunit [Deltaproteobacteria bacterium]
MRTWDWCFDLPPPAAIGDSEDDVLAQLEVLLLELEASGKDKIDRYLWDEDFQTREVNVSVHPQTAVKKRLVIGARDIPLRLTYAWSQVKAGGYRVMLPRFGWWFVLEELALAPEVLRRVVSGALLGENARSLFDFRRDGEEYVRAWSPRLLHARAGNDAVAEEDALATVRSIADDLVERAARGRLAPVVGAEQDPDLEALARRSPPPSLLLVGPPGVGKSTWVRRLARTLLHLKRAAKATEQHVPRLWSTSATRLIAGMVYLGMWQERCLAVVRELTHEDDFLYVDRLVPLLQPQPDGGSLGELLLPPLRTGELSVIAECTEPEYERCRRRFPSLVEGFQVLRVAEPPRATLAPLVHLYLARRAPGVTLHPAALRRLLHHLETFQRDAAFPGKAFRFVDWMQSGAAPGAQGAGGRTLYPKDVSLLYARSTGLPAELLAGDQPLPEGPGAQGFSAVLRRSVVGQDEACAVAARVLARFKAGMNDPERPLGTLLFVGPTGVGKTELARALARFMFSDEARMVRLDMSEYMFPGSAQRLLDTGAGVQSLAQRVREQPLSLVLLDEIEKAHPEVFDLLLGVLGEGRLTDAFGGTVDFRMSVVVMTSNLGVTELSPVGFSEARGDDGLRAVRAHFRPEFFNRIDHVIAFRRLTPEDVLKIVDLELEKAAGRTGLVRRSLRLDVDTGARARLAHEGFHPTRGARPLRRVIEERVMSPLAALLARDPALRETTLRVGEGGDIVV